MKLIPVLILSLITCTSLAQTYGAMDVGYGYRTSPITNKGQIATAEKTHTSIMNVTVGYMMHIQNADRYLDLITEVNARIPMFDNTNAVSTGIRSGIAIPLGNVKVMPMAGAWYSFRSAAATCFTAGATLRIVYTVMDSNAFVQADYINKIAGISVGLIIRDKKLF